MTSSGPAGVDMRTVSTEPALNGSRTAISRSATVHTAYHTAKGFVRNVRLDLRPYMTASPPSAMPRRYTSFEEPPPMLIPLTGPSRPPLSGGKPRRLVSLLHGLGADGNDLIGWQQDWGPLVPDAEFVSPNAPFPCDMAPYGYQWFSVQDRSPATVLAGVTAAEQ